MYQYIINCLILYEAKKHIRPVVVKLGYLDPDLYNAKADWMLALTPGGADQDLEHLSFKRIHHPVFPFEKDMAELDLKAKLIPVGG